MKHILGENLYAEALEQFKSEQEIKDMYDEVMRELCDDIPFISTLSKMDTLGWLAVNGRFAATFNANGRGYVRHDDLPKSEWMESTKWLDADPRHVVYGPRGSFLTANGSGRYSSSRNYGYGFFAPLVRFRVKELVSHVSDDVYHNVFTACSVHCNKKLAEERLANNLNTAHA